jgi:hypothetical protein
MLTSNVHNLKKWYFHACELFCVTDENILYLVEMPETEGSVRCELIGDAKVNALNLKVFHWLLLDYIL